MTKETPKKLDGSLLQLSDEDLKAATGGENIPTLYQAYCTFSGCNWKVNCRTWEQASEYISRHNTNGEHNCYIREIPNPHYI